jgi:hypothetical protein
VIELEERERELLHRARRGLSPSHADEARVLAATLGAAASAGALLEPSFRSSGTALSGKAAHFLLGVLALGLAGTVGYGLGHRAGSTSVRAVPAVASARRIEADFAGEWEPGSRASTQPELPERSSPEPAPATTVPPTQRQRGPITGLVPQKDNDSGLDEEVRQLRRIERAIREGNPRLALVLAEELDRAIPGGQLHAERGAAAMMAGCQLGVEGAEARAARFVAQNPSSGYAARLRELCKLHEGQRK